MIKFLTIIFFLYYFCCAVFNHGLLRKSSTNMLNNMKNYVKEHQTTNIDTDAYMGDGCLTILFMAINLLICFIEFIYLFFVIKYDPYTYVVICYIIFWLFTVIKSRVVSHKNKTKDIKTMNVDEALTYLDKAIVDSNKTTKFIILQYITDLSFYIYMVYVLFIR